MICAVAVEISSVVSNMNQQNYLIIVTISFVFTSLFEFLFKYQYMYINSGSEWK